MVDDEKLKEKLRREAGVLAERLRQDPSTLAVILTGPLALGKASETDKLYLAVITDRDDGIIEHHFLDDGLDEVTRPIEMGKFPLAVARYLIEHGYSDMVSYKSLEAFRCGQILWQKEAIGAEIVDGSKRHIPGKTFMGESLHGAVSALDDAVSLLKNGDYINSVIVARDAAVKAVAMTVREKLKDDNISFLEAAERVLPSEQFEAYMEIMGLTGLDSDTAKENASHAREFAEYTLREIGVDPEHILGPPAKEPPV